MHIKIGVENNKVSIAKAKTIIELLENMHFNIKCEILIINKNGSISTKQKNFNLRSNLNDGFAPDQNLSIITNLEKALLTKKIDIAASFANDISYNMHKNLKIGCILKPFNRQEALISKKSKTIKGLPINAKVIIFSKRVESQIKAIRIDLKLIYIKEDILYAIKDLFSDLIDAIICEKALLDLLKIKEYVFAIPTKQIMPAIGQGMLCALIRKNTQRYSIDGLIEQVLLSLMQKDALTLLLAEKGFYEYLKMNNNTLIAGHAKFTKNNLVACEFLYSGSNINNYKIQNNDVVFKYIFKYSINGIYANSYQIGIDAAKYLQLKIDQYFMEHNLRNKTSISKIKIIKVI